jgi:hypothetical protein
MHTELRRSAHVAWLAAALLTLGGCTLVGDFGRYTYEDEDASAPDAASGDLGADADLADAGRDAELADFGVDGGTLDLGADADVVDLGFDAEILDFGVDGGPLDLGFDAGPADLGFDSGPRDLGFDSGPADLGFDAGPADLGFDSGPADLGFDSGPADLGFDSGPADLGFDAGPADLGFDSGPADLGFDSGPADLGFDSGPADLGFDGGSPLGGPTYIKASNPGDSDNFGYALDLSADGATLAVGAWLEDSSATGINGDQTNDAATLSGAVYVFRRSAGGVWSQEAYLKASNTGADDYFGYALALSADGVTLAVGARGEDSSARTIGGDQTNNAAMNAGAVYVFRRSGTGTWSQEAYVKASNADAGDRFGEMVAISADGTTLAVGASEEDSAAMGVGGSQTSNSSSNSGAVYVFRRSGAGAWAQEAYVKASNTGSPDYFGVSLTLSGDGATLAVGAFGEDSAATGVGGDQTSNAVDAAGAVYVFRRSVTSVWSQEAYIKASNTGAADQFGLRVALAGDGLTLAVNAYVEDSAARGINGDQMSNAAPDSGAVYVFRRVSGVWSQDAYVKASNTDAYDYFGASLDLSSDGAVLAVSATLEDSLATGLGGDPFADFGTMSQVGAAYLFRRVAGAWSQTAYVKASNAERLDYFSYVALSGDGATLAVGAWGEDSNATGVGGDQTNNTVLTSGAVYVY